MRLTPVFHFQVDAVIIEVSIPFTRCPLFFILALIRTVWVLMPRAIGINCVVLVSSRYDAAHHVLAPSVGEPTVEPLVSDKAAIVTDTPKRAVLGYVVGVRELALGALDMSGGAGTLDFRSLRDMRLSSHRHYPVADSWLLLIV